MSEDLSELLQRKIESDPKLAAVMNNITVLPEGHETAFTWDSSENQAELLLQTYTGLQTDEHGKDTPKRFLAMLDEVTQCKPLGGPKDIEAHIDECVKWKSFAAMSDDMVVIEKIPFVSICNHHVLPFTGYASIGYVPEQHVAGLSKFARVVKHFARQLQVQERLTGDVITFIQQALEPKGCIVVLRAEHMCMTIRGIQAPGTLTTTSAVTGVFADHTRTAKAEFLALIGKA